MLQRKNPFLSFAFSLLTLALALPPVQAHWYHGRAYAPYYYRHWHPPVAPVAVAPYYPAPYYRPGVSTGTAILGAVAAGAAGLGLGAFLASSHGH